MSMIGKFREITPKLLKQLQDDPSLTEAVILGSYKLGAPSGSSELDALFGDFPARQREQLKGAMERMPPEVRQKMLEKMARSAETLRDLAQAARSRGAPDGAEVDPQDLGEQLDIQKAWHGLHYLLAGSTDVTPDLLSQVILGGTEIGEDAGYGPPRYFGAERVSEIAVALSNISAEELRRRYDGDAMNAADLYPGGWENEENIGWLADAYENVLAFYKGAATRRNAALLYLT